MRKPMSLLSASIVTAMVLACPAARAETASCDVTFAHTEKAFKDLAWDSGWLPKNEDIQVRFKASCTGGIDVSMPSTSSLTRGSTFHGLSYAGKADQGLFKMGLETSFKAYIKIDKTVSGVKIKYDGELPLPGKLKDLNKTIGDQASFTPLALPGAAKRPIKVALTSPKYHLITIDTPLQISIKGVASVKVRVPIYLQTALNCEFKGKRIETKPRSFATTLTHASSGATVNWPADGKLLQQGDAYYFGERKLAIELLLFPQIEVKAKVDIGIYKDSKTWTVAEFKISTDLVKDSKDWDFGSQPLKFTFTNSGPDPLGDGFVPQPNDAGLYPDLGTPITGDGAAPGGDGAAASGDGSSDAADDEDGRVEGACNCRVAPASPGLPLSFALLGLLLIACCRRRR